MSKKCCLVLEDGTEFKGISFGYEGDSIGEAVANTSMGGYQEILTDPSSNGQIVAMTCPMIGNYGVNDEDAESNTIQAAGLVVKEYSKIFSNFRATMSLGDYLKNAKIPAIEGVDTRKLTVHLRDNGTMRAGIFFDNFNKEEALKKLKSHPSMLGLDLTSKVSCEKPYVYSSKNTPTIGVYDLGVKTGVLRLLTKSGFSVKVYPAKTPLADMLKDNVSAICFSNGPGDPETLTYVIDTVKEAITKKIPIFGVCLGHQVIATALGGKTFKLKFGHRGNQPVQNLNSRSVEITPQNHSFAVDYDSLKNNADVEITHINLNDNTVEGLRHKKLPIMSIQHYSEASFEPKDSKRFFEEFYKLVKK